MSAMTTNPDGLGDINLWLADHGDMLFRYALMKVRDEDLAKDLVQETLLAAWKSRSSFEGRSAEKTWLVAILKNKLVDHFRRSSRELPFADPEQADAEGEDDYFVEDGHFALSPGAWGNPERSLENAQFWKVFESCLDQLRPAQRSAFVMREVHGQETAEICKELEITESNLWVLMHRARLSLRQCLDMQWFRAAPPGDVQ